jgi:hypothetical protein
VIEGRGKTAKLVGTADHPIWCVSRQQWVALGSLKTGDRLDGLEGELEVIGREVVFGRVEVFNITVAHAHSYRVSELGVLVHNGCGEDILQAGSNKIKDATAKALNDYHGVDLAPREWGRKVEALKKENLLRNDHHGKIRRDGAYLSSDGQVIDYITDY